MTIFAIALTLGTLAGLVLGGRPGRLAELRLVRPDLVLGAAALQLLPYFVALGERVHSATLLASYALAAAWLLVNMRRRTRALQAAFALLAFGWALNFAVVAANDGMPVSLSALRAVGLPTSEAYVSDGSLYKHVPAGEDTRLRALGDVIPLSFPNARVISPGDVALLLGGALLMMAGLTRPAMREPAPRTQRRPPLLPRAARAAPQDPRHHVERTSGTAAAR